MAAWYSTIGGGPDLVLVVGYVKWFQRFKIINTLTDTYLYTHPPWFPHILSFWKPNPASSWAHPSLMVPWGVEGLWGVLASLISSLCILSPADDQQVVCSWLSHLGLQPRPPFYAPVTGHLPVGIPQGPQWCLTESPTALPPRCPQKPFSLTSITSGSGLLWLPNTQAPKLERVLC